MTRTEAHLSAVLRAFNDEDILRVKRTLTELLTSVQHGIEHDFNLTTVLDEHSRSFGYNHGLLDDALTAAGHAAGESDLRGVMREMPLIFEQLFLLEEERHAKG
jgi:hypothetical protein